MCNANCSTTGLVVALMPLADAFGLAHCTVVTMQAISGAGYPGVSAMDITDNVIPFISGEEDKVRGRRQGEFALGRMTYDNSLWVWDDVRKLVCIVCSSEQDVHNDVHCAFVLQCVWCRVVLCEIFA